MNKFSPRHMSTLEQLESRLLFALNVVQGAKVIATPPPLVLMPSVQTSVNLSNYFKNTAASGSLVRFVTNDGNIDLELRDSSFPTTVANFLSYVNSGAYTNTLFHRTIPTNTIPGTIRDSGSTTTVIHTNINAPSANAFAGLMFEYVIPSGFSAGFSAFGHIVSNTAGPNSAITISAPMKDPADGSTILPASGASIDVFSVAFVQGGEYGTDLQHIATSAPIADEMTSSTSNSNSISPFFTIGASRNPSTAASATSGFFFNLTDNSSALDKQTSTNASGDPAGYVPFGIVVNNTSGTVTTISQTQTTAATLPDVPALNISPGAATNDIVLESASVIAPLNYSVSSGDPSIVTASLDSNNNLILTWHASVGSATINVTATSPMTLPVANGTFVGSTAASFTVTADAIPPSATLRTPAQPSFRAGTMTFNVAYSDASGIDTTTLGNDDITVIDPAHVSHAASFVSDTVNPDGSVTATYSFAPTDRSFGPADNGNYTVQVNDHAVTDTPGNATPQADLGSFAITFDSQPPSASLVSIGAVGPHSPFAVITVEYSDNSAVDASTLGANDLLVTGPDSFGSEATLVSTGLSNGATVTAQYHVAAPSGGFIKDDTYNVAIPAGAITDTTANGIAGVESIGTFTVVNDDAPPLATLSIPAPTGGELRLKFTITYTDATGVDAASILNTPVTVTGPNGFAQTAILQSPSITDGTSIGVTYRINAPSSFFTAADDGTYTISIPANSVQDVVFNTMAAQTMDFNVNIPPAPDDPDLVTSVSSVTSSISPLTKNKAIVNVKNVGNLPAKGKTTIKLYASTDDELDANDTLLSTTKEKISMKAGANKNYSLKFNSPMNLPTGTYRIIAVMNQDATLVERYTKNNESASGNVTITAPFVDLQPTAITSLPKTITAGKKSSTSVTIVNHGNVAAKGNAVIELFASADSTLDVNDPTLLTLTKGINIKPGKSVKIPLKFLLPAGLIAGGSHDFLASTVSFPTDNNADNNSVFSATTVAIA